MFCLSELLIIIDHECSSEIEDLETIMESVLINGFMCLYDVEFSFLVDKETQDPWCFHISLVSRFV